MYFINSLDEGYPDPTAACRACGSSELSAYVVASSKGLQAIASECEYLYHRCKDCGSLNEFSEAGNFYEQAPDSAFMNYYVDINAGLDEMLSPIGSYADALGNTQGLSFLELGCGFGFVVDYAAKCRGFQAAGIEPSGYGRIGEQQLRADISEKLLGDGSRHDDSCFDIIFSSEVIEHIPEPSGFATVISQHLTPNGVAIFTTPNAEFIAPEGPAPEVYSALFPGEHKIIFTEKGLRTLLAACGFSHLTVKQRRSSNLIAYASTDQRSIKLAESTQINDPTSHTREYLSTFRDPDRPREEKISRLGLAMYYRLFKDFVNKGWTDKAIELLQEMRPSFRNEVDASLGLVVPGESTETEELLHEMLALCGMCLFKESILSKDHHLTYPAGSIAFGKAMGFYITTVIHLAYKPEPAPIINMAIQYLHLFIDYGLWLRSSRCSFYHLEAISLIGPAVASLYLFQLKAGTPIDRQRFACVEEAWFRTDHPVSYQEIQLHLQEQAKRQNNATTSHQAPAPPTPPLSSFRRALRKLRP